jgi:hypothetical protein
MIRLDEISILRQRVALQKDLAENAPDVSDRPIHAELAAYYSAVLRALEKRQPRRFTGFA